MDIGKKYTSLSALLLDMPSDKELEALYGKPTRGCHRRPLTQKDLYILQRRVEGWSYTKIGNELCISCSAVRAKLLPIKLRLTVDLKLQIDVPGIFS